jgi:signal transduction histidine kinase
MKLLPKLTLLSIGMAAIPLAIAGYSSIRVSQAALRAAIEGHELLLAKQIAEYVSSQLGNLRATMAVNTRILDLSWVEGRLQNKDEVLRKFLQFVYHQSDDYSVVALLDKEGKPLAPSAFQSATPHSDIAGEHEIVSKEEADQLPLLIPIAQVIKSGAAVGGMLITGSNRNRTPHATLAVRYESPDGAGLRIIAAAVSLRRTADHLSTLASNDQDILLLDQQGRIIISGRSVGPPTLERKRFTSHSSGQLPDHLFVAEYPSGGRSVIGAYVPAPAFQLGIVVERSVDSALREARKLGITTAFWVGVAALVAAVVGAAFARSLSARVRSLLRGSKDIARGKLDLRLEVTSNDELGELAKSFNAMTTSLDAARDEITVQTEMIVNWNATLEKRVDEKSRDLREAQDLLLRSRSLAAIGSLGAGVAHEINNPLTGVLGLAHLLLMDTPKEHPARPMIEAIEVEALRIQSIVANLLRFSQNQAGEDFRQLNLAHVLNDALELCGNKQLTDSGITLVRNVPDPSPPIRGNALQLQAAFIQLLQNAVAAMETGGTLTLETTLPGRKLLRLRISDTGHGIKPEHLSQIFDPFFTTKTQRTDTGIGLSVVHKIIEDHGGQIRVESVVDHGTTFWITLPISEAQSHLT